MNIMLTSAGRRSYLVKYFKDAIDKGGEIHVSNSSIDSVAMEYADHMLLTPLIYDEGYIELLKSYCVKNRIDAIIPLFDIDLLVLSRKIDEFEKIGVKLIVSDESVINVCNDKWKTFLFLKKNDIDGPKTFLSIRDALYAFDSKEVDFPLVIKPRWGMGSIGMFEADDPVELEVLYGKVKKAIIGSYLRFESGQDMENSVIIQEKLKGQEYGLDIVNDLDCNHQGTIVKKKFSMRAGETDCAEVVYDRDLEKLGKKIGTILGHRGNLDLDAFMVDGKPFILEMNPRFGGGYPFSHIAGADLPRAIIAWIKGETVDKSIFSAEVGVVGQKEISISILRSHEEFIVHR